MATELEHLTGLCRSMGLATRAGEIVSLHQRLAQGQDRVEVVARYGPRAPELRLFVGSAPPEAALNAGQLRALDKLMPSARYSISFAPERGPRFGLRFDVRVQGRWLGPALAEEAVAALGLARAWPSVAVVGERGIELDELAWLSVNLATSEVEIAWRHHDATAAQMAHAAGDAGVAELCRGLLGSDGPYQEAPLITRLRLGANAERPLARSVELPVYAYAGGDAETAARIGGWLRRQAAAPERYAGSLERLAGASDADTPCRSVVMELGDGAPELLVECAYGARAPKPRAAAQQKDAEEIVRRYETDILLSNHPFLSRLRREPVNLGHLWVVLANFWESIVHDFPARLSKVIANLDDDRLRSVFVKQLNDELGEGDYSRAHKAMFRTLLDAVERWRPKLDDDVVLAPARRFGRRLEQHLFSPDYHEAVGALMMVEIYGKQIDILMGDQFRRQSSLDDRSLTWLRLHETLEVDHADDSLRLAHMLPRADGGPQAREQLSAVWRGAMGVVDAGHAYFNDLYRVCYR